MKVDPKIVIWLALYHVMEDITNIYTTVKTTHELLRVHSSIKWYRQIASGLSPRILSGRSMRTKCEQPGGRLNKI